MKKLLILNFLFFIFYNYGIIYCQSNFTYVPSSITIQRFEINRNGEATGKIRKDLIVYGVDNQGHIVTYSYKHEKANDTDKKIIYSYEESGNKLSEMNEYIFIKSKEKLIKKEKYSYDKLGRCIKKVVELWVNGEHNVHDTTYSFDDKNNLIQKLYDKEKIVYTYNSNSQLIEEASYTKENNELVKTSTTTYKYDKKGQLLEELTKTLMDNKWINVNRYTYKYDKLGSRTYELYEAIGFGDDSELEKQSYINYKYDKHEKNLIQEDFYSYTSENTSSTYFEYDKRGLLVKVSVKSKLKQSGEIQPYWIYLFGYKYDGFQADIEYFEIPAGSN